METSGDVLSTRADDEPLHIEEEVLARAVVVRAADLVQRDRSQRVSNRSRSRAGDDAPLGEHDQVGMVDRHQGRQELRLRVLEVLVQYETDVSGVKQGNRQSLGLAELVG